MLKLYLGRGRQLAMLVAHRSPPGELSSLERSQYCWSLSLPNAALGPHPSPPHSGIICIFQVYAQAVFSTQSTLPTNFLTPSQPSCPG